MEYFLIIAFVCIAVMIPVYLFGKILFAGCTFLANLGLMDASLIPANAEQLLDVVGIDGAVAGLIITILVICILSSKGIIDLSTIFIRKEK